MTLGGEFEKRGMDMILLVRNASEMPSSAATHELPVIWEIGFPSG